MPEATSLQRRALDLFEETLDWPETGSEFEARLAAACDNEPSLLAAIKKLVAQDQHATRAIPTEPPKTKSSRHLVPPERIARWHLREVIGVGGMGTVYRAERADGVFEQTVAIKLLRPGLLSVASEARFADERRMLARLRHPNIAHLYDGGTDPTSSHAWLAMEYVVGLHITGYVAQEKLSLNQRLALFAETCEAVQCAHENLVVHADIKPSNILVTAKGEVKLLDFGIAQWIAKDDPNFVLPTTAANSDESGNGAFTPAYAAPERFEGGAATPAGDVYSLGVLLAELLNVDPLVRLDADLSSIVAKAKASDPTQRYRTVAALADDIKRYGGNFPLQSREHNWRYVGTRFVRRHRAGVALSALAASTLIAATIVMSTLYVRAEHARAQADQRFQEVRQLAKFMIFDLYDEFARVPGTTAGRRTLVSTAQQYLDRLNQERNAPLDLRLETQVGRARLATVAGVPNNPNLGDVVAARGTLDQVITELEALHTQVPDRADIKTELAFALTQRAAIDIWYDQHEQAARPRLARALSLVTGSTRSPRTLEVRQLIYTRKADAADWAEDVPGIANAARAGLDELATWPAAQRNTEIYPLYTARMLLKAGDSLFYSHDERGALDRYREADVVLRDASARWPDRPALISISQLASWSIATTLSTLGRNAEAIAEFESSIALLERVRAFDRNDVALLYRSFVARSAQADALSIVGRHEEAIARVSALVSERKARMNAAPADVSAERGVAYELFMLGTILDRAQRKPEACRAFKDSVAAFTALDRKGNLPDWDRKEHFDVARKRIEGACVPPRQNGSLVEPPAPSR